MNCNRKQDMLIYICSDFSEIFDCIMLLEIVKMADSFVARTCSANERGCNKALWLHQNSKSSESFI